MGDFDTRNEMLAHWVKYHPKNASRWRQAAACPVVCEWADDGGCGGIFGYGSLEELLTVVNKGVSPWGYDPSVQQIPGDAFVRALDGHDAHFVLRARFVAVPIPEK